MIEPMSAADLANADRFERIGTTATLATAARIRDDFAQWLTRYFDLDPVQSSDLVLAINEALANSAEFAYRATDETGTMDLRAWHDPVDATLTASITDHGVWRMAEAAAEHRSRGRGIPLMRALSDLTAIESSGDGTHVRLVWKNIRRR